MLSGAPSLRAGPALKAFGRQMARRSAWTGYPRWMSGWLAPLLAPLRPLRAGPLLGLSLTELAGDTEPPATRQGPSARPKGLAPTYPTDLKPGLRPPAASDAVSAWPPPRVPSPGVAQPLRLAPDRSAEAVARLPQQAPHALLAAFTRDTLSGPAARMDRSRRSQPLSEPSRPPTRLPRPLSGTVPGREQPWRSSVSEDATYVLRAPDGLAPPAVRAQPAGPLADAWSTRLDGPVVSLLTLTRLAGLAPAASLDRTGRPPRSPAVSAVAPTLAPRTEPLPEPSLGSRPAVAVPAVDTARSAPFAPFLTEDGAPFAPPLWSMLDVAAPPPAPLTYPAVERETTFSVVNPTLAPRLPFLTPPDVAHPVDLPIAAATARQGALAEATEEEDLEALAAKLKRILNEEARRHGIQV